MSLTCQSSPSRNGNFKSTVLVSMTVMKTLSPDRHHHDGHKNQGFCDRTFKMTRLEMNSFGVDDCKKIKSINKFRIDRCSVKFDTRCFQFTNGFFLLTASLSFQYLVFQKINVSAFCIQYVCLRFLVVQTFRLSTLNFCATFFWKQLFLE